MTKTGQNGSNGDDPLLTVRQLAEREGLTPRAVRNLVRKHGLPSYRVGGTRIRWSQYTAWLAAQKRT